MLVSYYQIEKFVDIFNKIGDKPLKGTAAFALAKIFSEVTTYYLDYGRKRTELVEEFCKRDEDGKAIKDEDGGLVIKKERLDEFLNRMSQLYSETVEISDVRLNVEDIGDVELTGRELYDIMVFFK